MDEQRQDVQLEQTHKFCAATGGSFEDLPEVMDDREGWRERVRKIRADSTVT